MFRSNWHVGPSFKLASLLIFALPFTCLAQETNPQTGGIRPPSPHPKEQENQQGSYSRKDSEPFVVTVVESPSQAISRQRAEADGASHDAEDLKAQKRAADAAEKQIFPSWVAAILSGFGTLGVIAALIQGQKALSVAKEANDIAADAGRRQVRAYLGGTKAAIVTRKNKDKGMYCRLEIQNFGQSPATGIEVNATFTYKIMRNEDWPSTKKFDAGISHPRNIAPGAIGRCESFIPNSMIKSIFDAAPKSVKFYWVCDIWWLDVYDSEQHIRLEMSQPLGEANADHYIGDLDIGGAEPTGGWTRRHPKVRDS